MTITVHIIDDCKCYAKELAKELEDSLCCGIEVQAQPIENIDDKTLVSELASELAVMLTAPDSSKRNDVLYINTNLKIADGLRQDQLGFKLLTWLRIKDVLNHCVLYSFETLHSLLQRSPDYLIATSSGTSFVQLPFAHASADINALSEKWADPANIQEILRMGFSIQQFRHREANWWGVKSLCEAHSLSLETIDLEYPEKVQEKLKDFKFAVAEYLYGFSINTIRKGVGKIGKIREEELKSLNEEIERVQSTIKRANGYSRRLIRYIRNSSSLSFLSSMTSTADAEDVRNAENLVKLEQKKQYLEDGKNRSPDELTSIVDMYLKDPSPEVQQQCYNHNVLYIDDNALDGWADILDTIFPQIIISTIDRNGGWENSDSLSKKVLEEIKNMENSDNGLALILLDLRLFGENINSLEVEKLSGFQMLKKIKESKYHYIPIIMFTASNKAFTYEILMKSGADGYWVKEGPDEQRDIHASIKNYVALQRLIFSCIDSYGEFSFLRQFVKEVESIKENDDLWWKQEKVCWAGIGRKTNMDEYKPQIPVYTEPHEDEVTACLDNIYRLLNGYLHRNDFNNPISSTESFIISSIYLQFGKIIEYIHNFSEFEYEHRAEGRRFSSLYMYMVGQRKLRGDRLGIELYRYRSQAVHTPAIDKVADDNINSLILNTKLMLAYLNNPLDLKRHKELIERHKGLI